MPTNLDEMSVEELEAMLKASDRDAMTRTETYSAVSKVDPSKIGEAALHHGMKGASFGLSTHAIPALAGQPRDDYLKRLEDLREAQPLVAPVAETVGSLAMPGPKLKALTGLGKTKALVEGVKNASKLGLQGGAYQALTGEGGMFSEEQLKDFLAGGAGSAGMYGAAKGLGSAGKGLAKAAPVAQGATDRVSNLLSRAGKFGKRTMMPGGGMGAGALMMQGQPEAAAKVIGMGILGSLTGAATEKVGPKVADAFGSAIAKGLAKGGDEMQLVSQALMNAAAKSPSAFASVHGQLMQENPAYKNLVMEALEQLPMEGQENEQQRTSTAD